MHFNLRMIMMLWMFSVFRDWRGGGGGGAIGRLILSRIAPFSWGGNEAVYRVIWDYIAFLCSFPYDTRHIIVWLSSVIFPRCSFLAGSRLLHIARGSSSLIVSRLSAFPLRLPDLFAKLSGSPIVLTLSHPGTIFQTDRLLIKYIIHQSMSTLAHITLSNYNRKHPSENNP